MQVNSKAPETTTVASSNEPGVQTTELPSEDWQAKISRKQQACLDKIPKEWLLPESTTSQLQYPLEKHPNRLIEMAIPKHSGIMTEREVSITEGYTVSALLEALAASKVSALEVTVAFSKRAAIAGQLTNCVTETYFEQAQERAKQLDAMKAEGKSAGPLHGLPISLKDGFKIKGLEATLGFVSFLGRTAENNSPLVDILLELGAVIYVKTNIPQTLMTADSHNNIFGRTLNPHNTMIGAGGSSGGEGALVAFRGSPLGVGTDIAGSIRIPSLCDGTYGFKPSASRIPYGGQASPSPPGSNFFLACAGPLANDIEALKIFSKAVIDSRPAALDSTALDIPWRDLEPLKQSKLKLGMIAEDPIYPLHPPIRRALHEAARVLEAQGHEIIRLTPAESLVAEATEVALAFFATRVAGPDLIEEGGEPAVNSVVQTRKVMSELAPNFLNDLDGLHGIDKLAALNVKRLAVVDHWRELWNKYRFDAVLSPSAQHTAVPHDQYGIPPYTVFLNTLDVSCPCIGSLSCPSADIVESQYPACVIPFMKSSNDLDPEPMTMNAGQYGPNCKSPIFSIFHSSTS